MSNESPTEALKNAIIAEVASDVLTIKDDVAQLVPLLHQLKESFPQLFDLLKSGMIETLEEINKGILEAGGERIDYVKGQLHVYIDQALAKALENNAEKLNLLISQFENQNTIATSNLRAQYDEVSAGMGKVLASTKKSSFPLWGKIAIPLVLVVAVVCSGVVCWQLAAYKEAVYMNAFKNQLSVQKVRPSK